MRTPQQVAERALILGALAFRGSLEVTNHPRASELSGRLLPWLHEIGCGDELDPIERRELATPLGGLSQSEKADVNCAGEEAAVLCWMLNLAERPHETQAADQSQLHLILQILKSGADSIIASATLRDRVEIADLCWQFVLILSVMRELRVEPPARDIVRRVNLERVAKIGSPAPEAAIGLASERVARMTEQERESAAGLYFVRDHVARWFLSDQKTYFGAD